MESHSIKGELSSFKTNKRFYEGGSIKGYKELKETFEKNGNNIEICSKTFRRDKTNY